MNRCRSRTPLSPCESIARDAVGLIKGGLGPSRLPLVDVAEGRPVPQREGLLERQGSRGAVGGAAGDREQALETEPIEHDDVGVEPVALGHRHNGGRAEPLAEA